MKNNLVAILLLAALANLVGQHAQAESVTDCKSQFAALDRFIAYDASGNQELDRLVRREKANFANHHGGPGGGLIYYTNGDGKVKYANILFLTEGGRSNYVFKIQSQLVYRVWVKSERYENRITHPLGQEAVRTEYGMELALCDGELHEPQSPEFKTPPTPEQIAKEVATVKSLMQELVKLQLD